MIETKKLNDATLRRITKSDNTYEDVHIFDVPGNVIDEGTVITDSVLANINYKDDNRLEFSISNVDLTPNTNKAIFYAKNGKLYCAIAGYDPLEITSLSTSNFLSKTGTVYANNTSLDYFNINSGLKLFSNRTRIGAIPQRQEESSNFNDATYIDFSTEEIIGKVAGTDKLKLAENVEIKNNGSTINIDSDGDINISHNNNSKLEINADVVSLSNSIFNLEMTSSTVKIKKQDTILFEVRSNGDVYIGNKTINDLIQEKINQYDLRRLLTNEITNHISCTLNDSNIEYTVYFSDTPSSDIIMNVIFVGSNIDNLGRIYRSDTNSYYELTQYYASDDSEDDYIEIRKVTSSGSYVSTAYFRGIYYRFI